MHTKSGRLIRRKRRHPNRSLEGSLLNALKTYDLSTNSMRFGKFSFSNPPSSRRKTVKGVFSKHQDTAIRVASFFYAILAIFLLFFMPWFSCNILVGCTLPIIGTFKLVENSLIASPLHWRMYWASHMLLLIFDYSVFLLPRLVLPKTYFFLKSCLLISFMFPQTGVLFRFRRFFNNDPFFIRFLVIFNATYHKNIRTLNERDSTGGVELQKFLYNAYYALFHLFLDQFGVILSDVKFNRLDFREIKDDETPITWQKRKNKQRALVAELITTERLYYRRLEHVEKFLALNILQRKVKLEPDVQIILSNFFSLWVNLTFLHRTLLNNLERGAIKPDREGENIKLFTSLKTVDEMKEVIEEEPFHILMKRLKVDCVKSVVLAFEETESLLPHLYKSFSGVYRLFITVFKFEVGVNQHLEQLVSESVDSIGLGMEGQLIQPLQRLFRYPLLLDNIYSKLTEGNSKLRLRRYLAILEKLTYQADNEAHRAENVLKMAEIDDRLRYNSKARRRLSFSSDLDTKYFSLMDPQNRIVYTNNFAPFEGQANMGDVHIFFQIIDTKNQTREVYKRGLHSILFNDLLLFTEVKRRKSKLPNNKVYYVKYLLPLFECFLSKEHSVLDSLAKTKRRRGSIFTSKDESVVDLIRRGSFFPITLKNERWKSDRAHRGRVNSISIFFAQKDQRDYWRRNFEDAIFYSNERLTSTVDIFQNVPFSKDVYLDADVGSIAKTISNSIIYSDYDNQSQEEEPDIEENVEKLGNIREKAAVLIQSRFRGVDQRKQYQERREIMLKAAQLIQANYRKKKKKRRSSATSK